MMFNDLLNVEMKRADRNGTAFSMVIFDIDNFKDVNDTYSHLVGDEVLKGLYSGHPHPILNPKIIEIAHYSCGFELSDRTNPT